jgi:hypothetical protein
MLEPNHLTIAPPFRQIVGQVLCVLMYEIYFADRLAEFETIDILVPVGSAALDDRTDETGCTGKSKVAADDGVPVHAASASEQMA